MAFFCHGLKTGIQLGFRLGNVGALAKSIAHLGDPGVIVALYSCDCGRDRDRERKDDLMGAQETLRKAIYYHPDSSIALYRLGLLLVRTGDFQQARSALLRAHSIAPSAEEITRALKELDSSQD